MQKDKKTTKEEAADIIGKAISYFGAESLLDNANGLTDFEKFTAWLYCEFLRGLPKKLNQDYIKEQSKVILGAIRKELGKMPDSTELIAQWDAEREMLEQKDFRGDKWRLAQNAYFDGFGSGYLVQKEQILQLAKNRYEMAMTFVSGNLDVNQAIQLDRLALVTIIQKMDSK